MSAVKSWFGFAWDVVKILYGREWDDLHSDRDELMSDQQASVIITPQARTMIARTNAPPCPANVPPLEGSIDARRTVYRS